MGNSNGIITAPVSIEDVRSVLGLATYNVATLCTSDRINMWSRKKPVHIRNAISHARTGEWWKGTFGDCGVDLSGARASHYNEIPGKYTADMKNGWEYTPPWGGELSPYRLEDFENYMHDALPPLFNFTVTEKVASGHKLHAGCMLSAIIEGDRKEAPGSLSFADIGATSVTPGGVNLADFYFGFVITDTNGKVMGRVAGPQKASAGICDFLIKNNFLVGHEYWAYPFLSSAEQEQDAIDLISTYYTLPNVERAKFRVVSAEEYADLNIFLQAKKEYDLSNSPYITYELKITTGSSIKVLASYVEVRYTTGQLNIGEFQQTLGSFDITASSPYTKTGKFSNLLSNQRYVVNLYLRTNMGIFQRSIHAIESAIDPSLPYEPWQPLD